MQLSVCLIGRNEARHLPFALRAVAGVADEVVFVDTGSTDGTPDIARAAGARVFDFAWIDDFAAARNHGFDRARGRWVLWIDCDEFLNPDCIPHLRDCLERDDVLAYPVIRRDFVQPMADDGTLSGTFVVNRHARLTRTGFGIRYEGRVHEQLTPPLDELAEQSGLRVAPSHVLLDHDCRYFAGDGTAKQQRNARLLEMEVRDRPGRLYWVLQLGSTLLDIRDGRGHERMREAVRLIAAMRDQPSMRMPIVMIGLEYAISMGQHQKLPLSPDEAMALAQRWFPRAAPLLWLQAKQDFFRGDFQAAADKLTKLVVLGRTHAYDIDIGFEPAIMHEDALVNLGVCRVRLADLDGATAAFNALPPGSRRYAEAQANLAQIRALRLQFGIPEPAEQQSVKPA